MDIHLQIIGWALVSLAVLHIGFPKYFEWRENLASLTLINRQMMQTHTFFIALVVLGIGLLCLTSTEELIHTTLGRKISLYLLVFWFLRLLFQLFYYSPKLWKGKRFETTVHIVFTVFWVYVVWVFGVIVF